MGFVDVCQLRHACYEAIFLSEHEFFDLQVSLVGGVRVCAGKKRSGSARGRGVEVLVPARDEVALVLPEALATDGGIQVGGITLSGMRDEISRPISAQAV